MFAGRDGADAVVDIGGQSTKLINIVLQRAAGADATLTGCFLDGTGAQIITGSDVSYSFTIGSTAKTLLELLIAQSKTWPSGAVGFEGRLTVADVIFSRGGVGGATPPALASDMAAGTNASRYAQKSQADAFILGRVG